MKHRNLALIISLLSAASITLLLIPAQLSNQQLWILFFVTFAVTFLLVWFFNEFIVFRDLYKLRLTVNKLINEEEGHSKDVLIMSQTHQLANDLADYVGHKNIQVEDLIKKSDLRKQFIADISHELKSPLFSAQGYVLTLLDGAIEDKKVREKFLKKAARNLDYLDILIQDLLTLSQIESKAIRMLPDHFDIVALSKEVLEERETKASVANIKLSCSCKKSPTIVYADYSRITQVIINLVNNAINYNIKGGSVIIDIQEKRHGVVVSVIDTGVGIEDKYRDKIFNRFFRIDKSRTMKKSTGLGLAIVKHILERHNTTIELKSKFGGGSTFSFLLPRDKTTMNESA